jgi:hypothetical protein
MTLLSSAQFSNSMAAVEYLQSEKDRLEKL